MAEGRTATLGSAASSRITSTHGACQLRVGNQNLTQESARQIRIQARVYEDENRSPESWTRM